MRYTYPWTSIDAASSNVLCGVNGYVKNVKHNFIRFENAL